MKTGTILIISAVVLIVVYLIIQNNQRQQQMLLQQQQQQQGGMLFNQNCKDNWLCATSTILGGLGGLLQGANINLGGSDDEPGAGNIA